MGQINLPDICITELANQNEVFNSCGLLVKPGIQKKNRCGILQKETI